MVNGERTAPEARPAPDRRPNKAMSDKVQGAPARTDPTQPEAPVESGRTAERRAAFLKAAKEVFLEHGYADANMAEIVRRAGGSLATLYEIFGDKRALFIAAVDDRVSALTQQMQVEQEANAPLTEGLTRIARDFLRRMLEAEALELSRLIIGKARAFPDLPREYLVVSQEKVRRPLAAYLRLRAQAGDIVLRDPEDAAGVFLDLLRSGIQMRALIDPDYAPSTEEIDAVVGRAIRFFIAGGSVL